ncbi:MAG: hypothetical protein OEY64_12475 [Nitrospinota bacterium]|nr:hypothetical protein [Nitrospinota bacterium]
MKIFKINLALLLASVMALSVGCGEEAPTHNVENPSMALNELSITDTNGVDKRSISTGDAFKVSWQADASGLVDNLYKFAFYISDSPTVSTDPLTEELTKLFDVDCRTGGSLYRECSSTGEATCELKLLQGSLIYSCVLSEGSVTPKTRSLKYSGTVYAIGKACVYDLCDEKSITLSVFN